MCPDELVLYKMHLLVNSERQSGCGCVWNVVRLLLIKDAIKWAPLAPADTLFFLV